MKKIIEENFVNISNLVKNSSNLSNEIEKSINIIVECIKKGNKVILFGNGGSAADAQHIAAEFIGRFQKERQSIPAIALTTDSSIITSLSNDYSFDVVYPGGIAVGIQRRQVESGGVVICSTPGRRIWHWDAGISPVRFDRDRQGGDCFTEFHASGGF